MLSPLRNRFGIPGVISVIALVFAMFGGAYAASNSGDSGKATASSKAKKGPRGPKGPKGDAGPAGSGGPAGPAGAKGDTGAAGVAGANGVSVASEEFAVGPKEGHCTEGGTKFISASGKSFACNGEEGPQGPQGIAGPAGPTCPGGECLLPVGATETGVWSFTTKGTSGTYVSISYPLRLSSGPPEFHYLTLAEQGTAGAIAEGCPGDFEVPKAGSGKLCMYESDGTANHNANPPSGPVVASSAGTVVEFTAIEPSEEAYGDGSWAVAE